MTVLVWYRNDLRMQDHQALAAACRSGERVRAIWLDCPGQWERHHVAPIRRWYVLESLRELGQALADRGIGLDIVACDDFSAVPDVLARYVAQHQVSALFCTREYPLDEVRRDARVRQRLEAEGTRICFSDDDMLVPPEVLRTGQGKAYTVFSPYRRAWDRWITENPPATGEISYQASPVAFTGGLFIEQASAALELNNLYTAHWCPGEQAAQEQLASFRKEMLGSYAQDRDYPALHATSRLSAALSAGTISVARCYRVARDSQLQQGESAAGAASWINELAWRDFYRQVLTACPDLCKGQPFRPETAFIQWSRNQTLFHRWCQGETGYPLVDAAMRQLNATGWMHNRLRMVTAMFLTKNLFIDWRWGEQYFMSHLVDGDFASNNGGWQWSASTGTDAVPWFRVFNPVRQSQRFDPSGIFIRQQLPALRTLSDRVIHQPWTAKVPPVDYPAPIVSLDGVRDRVAGAFRQARELWESVESSPCV